MVIKRRTLLGGAGVAAAAAIAPIACQTRRQKAVMQPVERPNILLLCIDDLRDWVGYKAAHPGVYTPNIDALRAQSYSYNRAYCSVPVCISSRGSVMWGLSPETAGLDGELDEKPYWALMKSQELHPLPYWFSKNGYKTISTGKVFHHQVNTDRFWDRFEPYEDIPVSWGDHQTLFDYGILPEDEIHIDQTSTNFAKGQLAETHDKPWLMAIGLYQPHVPWRLPQWAFDLHPLADVKLPEVRESDIDDLPQAAVDIVRPPSPYLDKFDFTQHNLVVNAGKWREHVQAYLAACSHTDAMIGQILAALESSEYADNTAVVLWSDHGYHLGEKLHWRKMALWEQATRVPLLVRAPWRVEPGGGFDMPVSLLDLGPTLMDLAGITAPAQFEGKSLLGITEEAAAERPAHMRWGEGVSTRIGRWRWTRYGNGGEELYDLSQDPMEFTNLVGKTGRFHGDLDTLRQPDYRYNTQTKPST